MGWGWRVGAGARRSSRAALGSEGDVVVGRARARARARARGCGRGRGRLVVTGAVAVGAGEELRGVGDDLDGFALVVFVRPFAPFQAAVDGDGAALAEVAVAVLALGAPDGDAEVVRLIDPAVGGLAAGVGGDPQAAHRGAALGGA